LPFHDKRPVRERLGGDSLAAHMKGMSDSMNVFDRRAVRHHRDRAARTVNAVADVLRESAERLLDRLDDTTRRFTHALDVGGRGITAPMLRARGIETVACDISPAMVARSGMPAIAADEEWLPFAPASFDLIVASLSLHWVNDLPGTLIQLRQALRPDGLLLASMPALGTLGELRTALTEAETEFRGGAAPRVSPFPDLRDCAGLLQRAGFALPVADAEEIDLLYADPLALLRDLRAAGEGNAVALRDRRTPPRVLFPAALGRLPRRDGRMKATLRLAMLTGWAPAPSQPQPLRRGSATTRLEDALRDDGTKPEGTNPDRSRNFPRHGA
jgi:SAM-dependent methyltransferase